MAYFLTFSTYGTHLTGAARRPPALETDWVGSLLVYIPEGPGDRMETYGGSDSTANAVG